MNSSNLKFAFVLVAVVCLAFASTPYATAQEIAGKDKKAEKAELKQLNKEANKTGTKAEEAAHELGRNKVFCILAAHTTDVGTAQQLKTKFDALTDFPFGQFVAAVLLADRIDLSLDVIITKLQVDEMSIGQITKEAGVNMGEVRSHFGQFRSELARSLTNPPTKDCTLE